MVILDLRRTGRRKFWAAGWLLGLIAIILSAVGGWFAGAYDMPWSLAAMTALVAYSITVLTQHGMRARRITYQMDRRVTEVMGRPFMDVMLDLDSRQRSQIRGPVGILVKIAPSEARRVKRLNTTKPRTQQTITR
jgi:hypothetical protein